MTQPHQHSPGTGDTGRGSHRGHGLMMIACCIPMLVISVALVATGVVGIGFLLIAVACTAMMALMMRGMAGQGPSSSKAGMSGMHEPNRRGGSPDDGGADGQQEPQGQDHATPR